MISSFKLYTGWFSCKGDGWDGVFVGVDTNEYKIIEFKRGNEERRDVKKKIQTQSMKNDKKRCVMKAA